MMAKIKITSAEEYMNLYKVYGPIITNTEADEAYELAHEMAVAVLEEPEFAYDADIAPILNELYNTYGQFVAQQDQVEKETKQESPVSKTLPQPVKTAKPKAVKTTKVVKAPKAKPVQPKTPKAKSAPKSKPLPKPAKSVVPAKKPGRGVPKVSESITFIKRFLSLTQKDSCPSETVRALYRSIAKAASERRINKQSPHAKELEQIANYLHDTVQTNADRVAIELDTPTLDKLKAIAESQHQSEAVVLVNQYIRYTKEGAASKENLQKLLERTTSALSSGKVIHPKNKLRPVLKDLKKVLSDKLENSTQKLIPIELELRGLEGIDGIEYYEKARKEPKELGVTASAADLATMPSYTLKLPGKLGKLFGSIADGAKILLSCPPGQGKSYFALDLAASLSDMGKRVLYISAEEYGNPSLADKLHKLGIPNQRGANLTFSGEMDAFSSKYYDVLIVDSVQKAGLTIEEFNAFQKTSGGKKTFMVLISQVTKDGKARGSNEWPHDVDIVVNIENGVASTTKNRYSELNSVKLR